MTQAAEYLRGESQLPVQSLDLDEGDRLRVYQFQDGSIPSSHHAMACRYHQAESP